MTKPADNTLLEQLDNIAQGISETFAPFCEVVVHDLQQPQHSILSIHNNLSGRKVGQAATEMGLARIASPDFPAVVANYANQFADGRPVKSTSIGLKDASGEYVAALCLNLDMTLFRGMQSMLSRFTETHAGPVEEHIEPVGSEAIRLRIDQYAAGLATTPRALKTSERIELLQTLKKEGLLDIRKSMETVAQHLGISRASVYLYAKQQPTVDDTA
ncbi:helix-turn-helix transcriptional regulator [Cedecea sp. P7760]|uniref:helix-turn-helix transcriptional regulator n=1 Tax=Cedecea TaxID=158483 RepID=UPI0015A1F7C2|nr:transcriptional regulator [Cedecea sp. P7760]